MKVNWLLELDRMKGLYSLTAVGDNGNATDCTYVSNVSIRYIQQIMSLFAKNL